MGLAAVFARTATATCGKMFCFEEKGYNKHTTKKKCNFLILPAAPEVTYGGGFLMVESRHMLIDSGFYDFAHFHGVCEQGIIHQHSVADGGIRNVDLGLRLQYPLGLLTLLYLMALL